MCGGLRPGEGAQQEAGLVQDRAQGREWGVLVSGRSLPELQFPVWNGGHLPFPINIGGFGMSDRGIHERTFATCEAEVTGSQLGSALPPTQGIKENSFGNNGDGCKAS